MLKEGEGRTHAHRIKVSGGRPLSAVFSLDVHGGEARWAMVARTDDGVEIGWALAGPFRR